jgi:hypothetical protein
MNDILLLICYKLWKSVYRYLSIPLRATPLSLYLNDICVVILDGFEFLAESLLI